MLESLDRYAAPPPEGAASGEGFITSTVAALTAPSLQSDGPELEYVGWVELDASEPGARGGLGHRPTSLDTLGKTIADAATEAAETAAPSARRAEPRRVRDRVREARPQKRDADAWRITVAAELQSAGYGRWGQNLRECGRQALTWECGACGDPLARVEVHASCNVRMCLWCSRRTSVERRARLEGAMIRVPDLVRVHAGAHVKALEARTAAETATREAWKVAAARTLSRAARRAAGLRARAAGLRDRAERRRSWDRRGDDLALALRREESAAKVLQLAREIAARHMLRAAAADRRRADAKRSLLEARAIARWRWKMVTISPAWDPCAPESVTAEGLRARHENAFALWSKCWHAFASVDGLAAAVARVECSDGAHVHVHALYYGPHWQQKVWQRTAGCIVDVRAVKAPKRMKREASAEEIARAALREAAKYVGKMPGPGRWEWIAGGAFTVMNPRLAAHWCIALENVQTTRYYGTMREAAKIEETLREEPAEQVSTVRACASCAEPLTGAPVIAPTSQVAKILGSRWTLRGRNIDTSARAELSARDRILLLRGVTKYPPRVVILRGD